MPVNHQGLQFDVYLPNRRDEFGRILRSPLKARSRGTAARVRDRARDELRQWKWQYERA
jgi:hypothetical protein